MKRMINLWLLSGAVLWCGYGCSTPPRQVMPGVVPPHTAESAVSAGRIKQFRKITGNFKVRGVGLYPEAFRDRYTPAEVAERVKSLGFNRAYCYITTETALDEHLTGVLNELGKRSIPAEIVVFQRDYYRKNHGNQLIRPFLFQYPTLKKAVQEIIDFNDGLPEEVKKISGITIIAGAHDFTTGNVERSHGQLYAWAENRYGIGRDNDMLMRQFFDELKAISAFENLPPLTIGIPDFYHDKAMNKELSCGTVADFAKFGKVMVINHGNVATQLVKRAADELKFSGKQPLLIAINLNNHTAQKEGGLRRRDWNDFCRALAYAGKNFAAYPSFEGMVTSPLALIEFLRQER